MQAYTKEWLEELCKDSYSYAEVLRKAGRHGGGSQTTLQKKIKEFGIDVSHFTGQDWHSSPNQEPQKGKEKYVLEEVFTKNSPISRNIVRNYIRRHNLIPYQCSNCGCDGHWQNGLISLQLHHIDGDNTNNELSNLTYLCPNCHALTETYCGKNVKLKKNKKM
jgi:5-methylcytosine-specific restriction endonuclease McrA